MDTYLLNINSIDEEIKSIRREKNKYIDSHSFKIGVSNLVRKFIKSKTYLLLMVLVSVGSYIVINNPIISILFTLGFILKINISFLFILKKWSPNEVYYSKIEEYDDKIKILSEDRSRQIIFYNYFKDKNNFLINNIKSKIMNKEYFDYQKYLDNNELSSKEINIFKKMQLEEEILINNIKNELNYQINYKIKDRETKDYLKQIQVTLS